jgi:hypothetical protein
MIIVAEVVDGLVLAMNVMKIMTRKGIYLADVPSVGVKGLVQLPMKILQ